MANYPRLTGNSRNCVLLTCHDAGGTVPPVLALAEALIARANEIVNLAVCEPDGILRQLEREFTIKKESVS